ncbi:Histidine kinase superfamily protein [Desulfonema limicola]|uniref:Histidine kinase superfamily protein n=1 Tax=Desulfonema limicola TaxID=45656 RepID=A0A975GEB9_9BACT|nr:anti-sigma regulatory factor [Desulfonema limicola]QTA77954.1 Histidine kinase superfamily protein [Desulfonema limicola]
MDKKSIPITDQSAIINARKIGRETAKQMGFGLADQTRLATAISEIARNAFQYAREAVCIILKHEDSHEKRITIIVEDKGPGIKDINKAMQDGYTTGKGLGAGLPGSKRLMHNFHIESSPEGTRVTMSMSIRLF